MKKKYFGTDGIRGQVNEYPIRSDFIFKLSFSLSEYLNSVNGTKSKKKVLIGKDTRASCRMIESSLISGFTAAGIDCITIGEVPTPLVSFLTRHLNCELGIMISASHNPYFDNGVKLFKSNGTKLTDSEELKIEKILKNTCDLNYCCAKKIGTEIKYKSAFIEYTKSIKKIIPKNIKFNNLKVVMDCANGSASEIAPKIFKELNINTITMFNKPNGKNINSGCGSLFPDILKKNVLLNNADIGFAFDGDADRLIVIDERGNLINGDKILAIVGSSLQKQDKLKGQGLIATKMSNYGLKDYLKKRDINLFECEVGDRYVIEEMKKRKCNLGGEQSGHIIFSDFSSTGDALLSALQILTILKMEKKKISEILVDFKDIPQKLINLRLNNNLNVIYKNKSLHELINELNNDLGEKGMVLVRKSGTENILRIMVQSYKDDLKEETIKKIESFIKKIDK